MCEAEEKLFNIDDCQQYIKTDILKYALQNDNEQLPFGFKNIYCILHKKRNLSHIVQIVGKIVVKIAQLNLMKKHIT